MAGSAAEEKTFRRFLELFLREMRPPLQENDPVPMRPLSDLTSADEVEGECLDMCLQHLCKYSEAELSLLSLSMTSKQGSPTQIFHLHRQQLQ